MKICMVGHFPPHIGGVSSYTYLLSKEISKRGDEVYVLTYPHKNMKHEYLKKNSKISFLEALTSFSNLLRLSFWMTLTLA